MDRSKDVCILSKAARETASIEDTSVLLVVVHLGQKVNVAMSKLATGLPISRATKRIKKEASPNKSAWSGSGRIARYASLTASTVAGVGGGGVAASVSSIARHLRKWVDAGSALSSCWACSSAAARSGGHARMACTAVDVGQVSRGLGNGCGWSSAGLRVFTGDPVRVQGPHIERMVVSSGGGGAGRRERGGNTFSSAGAKVTTWSRFGSKVPVPALSENLPQPNMDTGKSDSVCSNSW